MTEIERELLIGINQYLESSSFHQTITCFQTECSSIKDLDLKSFPPETITNSVQKEFMAAFHNGDCDMFFALWQDHVQVSPSERKNLEILLAVYFAIFPILENQPLRREIAMEQFKRFLELHGEWAQEPEFLQYYALPYLPDPKAHPSFHLLFESNWKKDLERQLNQFLATTVPKTQPKLIQLLSNAKLYSAISVAKQVSRPATAQDVSKEILDFENSILDLKGQLKDSTKRERDLLQKLKVIRSDYHQLLTVSTELVSTLMAAINQERVDPAYLADIVKRLGSLKKPGNQSQEKTPAPVPVSQKNSTTQKPVMVLPSIPQGPILQQLDFSVIQNLLMSLIKDTNDEFEHIKLLQNLRYFVSTDSPMKRKENLEFMIEKDFLGMNQATLIPYLLHHTHPVIREQCARLINAISTHCIGRAYLVKHDGLIIQDMVQSIKVDPHDSVCRQNLLGSLQKLSLRRLAQSVMNESQTITYLSSILNNLDSLSEYSIEYGSALFMNLCLRSKGKKEACSNPEVTLKILNELIDHENIQVKTYVNGCLYSLFADPVMREQAQNLGMETQLQYLKQLADDSLAKQIDFVIEKLTRGITFFKKDIDEAIFSDDESEDELEDGMEDDPEEDIDEEPEQDVEVDNEFLFKFLLRSNSPQESKRKQQKSQPILTSQQLQSMQIQLPMLESTKKGKLNLPISKAEKEEFNFGFSTRPKVPRTPISIS